MEIPEYDRQTKISALEPFREIIFEMTNVKKFKGSRILNEVSQKGIQEVTQHSMISYLK